MLRANRMKPQGRASRKKSSLVGGQDWARRSHRCARASPHRHLPRKQAAAVRLQPVAQRRGHILVWRSPRCAGDTRCLFAQIGLLHVRRIARQQRCMLGLVGLPGGVGVRLGFVGADLQHISCPLPAGAARALRLAPFCRTGAAGAGFAAAGAASRRRCGAERSAAGAGCGTDWCCRRLRAAAATGFVAGHGFWRGRGRRFTGGAGWRGRRLRIGGGDRSWLSARSAAVLRRRRGGRILRRRSMAAPYRHPAAPAARRS